MTDTIDIRRELRAGDIGRIISLHGSCYDLLPGFGVRFEAYVARTMAEFVIDAGTNGRIWMAEQGDRLVGCTAIVLRGENRAQLRWVLVDPIARGAGLGRKLVECALDYCRDNDCRSVYLETTDGLAESQALYESLGFATVFDRPEELWDGVRPLIQMELALA